MATHSSTLACKIPWMEECGRLQSMGSQESDTTEQLHFYFQNAFLKWLNQFRVLAELNNIDSFIICFFSIDQR